jgi:hypothetical protein
MSCTATTAQQKGSGQLAMNRSKQAGMAIKAVIVLLVGLALASVHLAEAQQPKKVPRIGYLSTYDPTRESARAEVIRLAARAWLHRGTEHHHRISPCRGDIVCAETSAQAEQHGLELAKQWVDDHAKDRSSEWNGSFWIWRNIVAKLGECRGGVPSYPSTMFWLYATPVAMHIQRQFLSTWPAP